MRSIVIDKYIQSNEFGRELGMDFKILEPGVVEYYLTIEQKHLATPKAAHGGVIAAFMDSILGVTALSAVAHDYKAVSTVEFKINFLAPVLIGDQLKAIGKVESQGKRILVTSADVLCMNRKNACVAKGIGTFNAYPVEKAGY